MGLRDDMVNGLSIIAAVSACVVVALEYSLSRVPGCCLSGELPVDVLDKAYNLGERKRANVSALFRFLDNNNLPTQHLDGVPDVYDLVRFVARI